MKEWTKDTRKEELQKNRKSDAFKENEKVSIFMYVE